MVTSTLAAPPSPEDVAAAEERRGRLLAAMLHVGINQSDLRRKLIGVGERTTDATISNWCQGGAALTEVQLRGLLSLLGLPPNWEAPRDLVSRGFAEAEARKRKPKS